MASTGQASGASDWVKKSFTLAQVTSKVELLRFPLRQC
jgi:hypothetical protein